LVSIKKEQPLLWISQYAFHKGGCLIENQLLNPKILTRRDIPGIDARKPFLMALERDAMPDK